MLRAKLINCSPTGVVHGLQVGVQGGGLSGTKSMATVSKESLPESSYVNR